MAPRTSSHFPLALTAGKILPSMKHAVCTLTLALTIAAAGFCFAQDNSNWTSTEDRRDPNGKLNPTRTRESHTESNGRTIDRKTVERLGPDGRYVPYLDTETETVRVDANTTRTTERSFGRGPDGQRTLMQQT